ncbi:glycosyltransferase family 4 protein [Thermanaerothrix sp.]|jgi:glycosyltransferase involved in cell wall biosynthesis|uniref:glycosyltransferase family 4 protein n=1 Tax=Thermanaerothrix sp. TaxID=2972675 RepID=UPI002ADE0B65|nr:glycosyltransferase family 4 protein [Thermanaerothrix sp.]
MRVGLIIYGDLNTLSGGYLYDRYLVHHLQSQGDEVYIISQPWRGYGLALLENVNIKRLKDLGYLPLDVLLEDELNHPSLFWLNRHLRSRVRYPIISIVHHLRSSEPYHPHIFRHLYRWIEQAYINSVDGFIFNSRATQQSVYRASRSAQVKPHCIVYPGGNAHGEGIADLNYLVQRSFQKGPLHILFLGNLIRRKRLDVLLSALMSLPRTDWMLNIVGRTDLEPKTAHAIHALIRRHNLRPNIRFWGPCNSETLQKLLRSHHILAVPSDYEGFGIAYLEAMAYGVVPIATTSGGAAEIIIHGQNGFLIPPGRSDALARMLALLHEQRETLAQMSLAARTRYEQFPTWGQGMTEARRFLQTVITSLT